MFTTLLILVVLMLVLVVVALGACAVFCPGITSTLGKIALGGLKR